MQSQDTHLFRSTSINNILDVRDRDGSLSDVRCDNDETMSSRRFGEDLHLLLGRKQRVQREDVERFCEGKKEGERR